MATTDGATETLGTILDRAETDQKTARAVNVTDRANAETVSNYLSKHGVDLHVEQTDSQRPTDALLLESDGQFLAGSPLGRVARYANASAGDRQPDDSLPAVVTQLDDTRFDSYDKRRMVLASRIVEFRAWNHRDGELHAGFQQLSKVNLQKNVYRNLSTVPLDVHVYGEADWDRPDDLDIHVHANDSEEVSRHWWVVYDGNGRDEDKATLLAQEVGDNEFFGYWTYDPVVADRVIDRLEAVR
ncbi:DICT sensory domain-containing protein [Haloarchaeobius sp. FL176]|uniref:DICT sensory domain-containing protein n=1 Tax=Haloarchaeobius sp. FL176 TaxID=2967129 RepID=UPI00214943BE|nr:DICT sensory domain-containing protein [Haloarchaeobius sp. FL176]